MGRFRRLFLTLAANKKDAGNAMVTAPQKGRSGGHADGSGKKRIGELLIEEGLITSEALKEALAVQGKEGGKTVEILISLGHLTSRDFVNFLAKQEGVASIDLGHYEIAPDIIGLVPKDLAVKHEVIPIDKLGKLLTVGDDVSSGLCHHRTHLGGHRPSCQSHAVLAGRCSSGFEAVLPRRRGGG